MVSRKKPEIKKISVLKKPSKRKLMSVNKGYLNPFDGNKFVLEAVIVPPILKPCKKNPLRSIEKIPYMGADAAMILRSYGFVNSDSFLNLDIYAKYDQIVCPDPLMPSWKKQIIINGLRIGSDYANGVKCVGCCELERLIYMIPGLNSTAAKQLLKVFSTAQMVFDMIAIGPSQVGINGAAYVWYIYDWVFAMTDMCPGEAKLLHEGLTYAVHFVNQTQLSPGPGYPSRSPPN